MKLRFIGTGAGSPSHDRNVSCLVLELLNEIGEEWMVDCGEGTQRQLLKTNVSPSKIGKIFITHLHGDHIYGLPGLLSSISNMGRKDDLDIFAPSGLKDWLLGSLRLCGTRLSYKLNFYDISDGRTFDLGDFEVKIKKLKHDVDSYGFKFIQKDLLGVLDVKKAISLGVPSGPLLGKLKNGKDVELDNGLLVKSKDVVGERKKGKKIVVFGDTSYSKDFIDFVKDVDVLVYESTFFEKFKNESINKYGHSSNIDAAKLSKAGNVGKLYLNHVSSRYGNSDLRDMIKETRKLFVDSYVTNDFDEYNI